MLSWRLQSKQLITFFLIELTFLLCEAKNQLHTLSVAGHKTDQQTKDSRDLQAAGGGLWHGNDRVWHSRGPQHSPLWGHSSLWGVRRSSIAGVGGGTRVRPAYTFVCLKMVKTFEERYLNYAILGNLANLPLAADISTTVDYLSFLSQHFLATFYFFMSILHFRGAF